MPGPSHLPANIVPSRLPQYPIVPPSYPAGPSGMVRSQSAPGPSDAHPAPVAGPSTSSANGLKRKSDARESSVVPPSAPKRSRRSTRLTPQVPEPSSAEPAEAGPSTSTAPRTTRRRRGSATRKQVKRGLEVSSALDVGSSNTSVRSPSYDEDDDHADSGDDAVLDAVGPKAYERFLQDMKERGKEEVVVVRINDDGQPELACVAAAEEGTYVAFQLDTSHWANQYPEGSPGRAGMEALQSQMLCYIALTGTLSLLEPCKEGETQLEMHYLAADDLPLKPLGECYLDVKDWFFTRNPVSREAKRRSEIAARVQKESKAQKHPGEDTRTVVLEPWPDYVQYLENTKQYAVLGTKLLVTQYTDAPKGARWDISKYAMKCVGVRHLRDRDVLHKANEAYEKFKQDSREATSAPCSLADALQTLSDVGKPDGPTKKDVKRASNVVFGALRMPEVALPAKVWRDISAAPAPAADPLRFAREVEFVQRCVSFHRFMLQQG